MKTNNRTVKQGAIILVASLVALEAWGGKLGFLGKIAGKLAEHGADNVAVKTLEHGSDNVADHVLKHGADNAAEHMLERGADEAEEAAAKGAAKVASKGAARGKVMEEALERSLQMAKKKQRSHIPATVLAAGGAVAMVDAAHNLSTGSRHRNESIGQAEGKALEENPELVVDCRAQENRWKNILASGGAAALVALVLPFGLRGFRRKDRRERKSENIAVQSGNGSDDRLIQGGRAEQTECTSEPSAETNDGNS